MRGFAVMYARNVVSTKPEEDLLAPERARCLPPFHTPWSNFRCSTIQLIPDAGDIKAPLPDVRLYSLQRCLDKCPWCAAALLPPPCMPTGEVPLRQTSLLVVAFTVPALACLLRPVSGVPRRTQGHLPSPPHRPGQGAQE